MSAPGMTTTTLAGHRDAPDAAAIETAWREFTGELRTFIRRRVSRPEDADDILQLVALRLTQNQSVAQRASRDGSEERDRRTLLAWLYTVTRNAITDYYRSAVHRREVVTDALPDLATPGPADDDDAAERALAGLASCVRPLLRLLPAEHAAAVELVDLAGRSQVDAARAAGISVSGMKSRVQRGRRGLQEAITACCQIQLDVRGAVQEVHSHHGSDCSCSAGT